jgi:hypothetical protein
MMKAETAFHPLVEGLGAMDIIIASEA